MIGWATAALALLLTFPAIAGVCETAAMAAEQAAGLPTGLLAAIGRIESGRRGSDGRTEAWPWSVNAAGQGYFLASASEAVALVTSLQARGIRSVDVGCFQMNLLYHGDAFEGIAPGFDPASNAMAAARFLRELRTASADWPEAVARYHSANPAIGLPYMHQVMASLSGGPAMPAPPLSQVAARVRVFVPGGVVAVVALPRRAAGSSLPVVITPTHRTL